MIVNTHNHLDFLRGPDNIEGRRKGVVSGFELFHRRESKGPLRELPYTLLSGIICYCINNQYEYNWFRIKCSMNGVFWSHNVR